MKWIMLVLSMSLTACATIQLPPGSEESRSFVQESPMAYQDAYRIVAKQFRVCYRVIGIFGNGYDVQADLDAQANRGTIELYSVGFTGAEKPEDSIFSRSVTIEQNGSGSRITTTGTTPKYVYMTHLTVPSWLSGTVSCAPPRQ